MNTQDKKALLSKVKRLTKKLANGDKERIVAVINGEVTNNVYKAEDLRELPHIKSPEDWVRSLIFYLHFGYGNDATLDFIAE